MYCVHRTSTWVFTKSAHWITMSVCLCVCLHHRMQFFKGLFPLASLSGNGGFGPTAPLIPPHTSYPFSAISKHFKQLPIRPRHYIIISNIHIVQNVHNFHNVHKDHNFLNVYNVYNDHINHNVHNGQMFVMLLLFIR